MDPSGATTPLLSVAMIVADDPAGLQETLNSVQPIADEIVVVDTGIADSATACVARLGGRRIVHPWCDSFAVVRNECMRHARGKWILWLDAGETMGADDARRLREYLSQREAASAYALLVKCPPAPGTVDGEQVARVRVVPRRQGVRFHGRVRESLHGALEQLGIPLEGLPFRVLRGTDVHDPDRKERRARRNIELADMELRDFGPQPRLLNCLAEAFLVLRQPHDATVYFRNALDRASPGSLERLEAHYGLLTLSEGDGDAEARLKLFLTALADFPLDLQLLCAMGGFLQAAGQWDLALRSYETGFRFGQIQPELWHLDHLRSLAAQCYASCLQLQGRTDECLAVLRDALSDDPNAPRLRRQLLETHLRLGQQDEALELLDRTCSDTATLEVLRNVVRGACLAGKKNWPAARAYLQVAYRSGCRDPLCLRWLAVTLLATDRHEEARGVLTEWARFDPQNPEPARYLEAFDRPQSGGTDAASAGSWGTTVPAVPFVSGGASVADSWISDI